MMILTISLVVALLGLGLFVWQRQSRRQQAALAETRHRQADLSASNRFHAVSIRFAAGACQASQDLHGRRFLSAAAPLLPLPDCDAAECRCRFVHHKDRRAGDDRRHPFQSGFGGSSIRIDEERRQRDNRRADDTDSAFGQ
ncbi:MAG: hypothetical protein U5K76_06595 [Woeseiaceae bacterium]|nr:hypothetical protein [Woeseiaceae bacterium]